MGAGVILGVSAIGLGIAQRLLTRPPKEFKQPPRFDDFSIQTGSEGSPIKRAFGSTTRVAGTVIWSGLPVQELDANGDTQIYIDMAIGICEGPIAGVSRVYAEDRVLFGSDVTVTTTSDDVAIFGAAGYLANRPSVYMTPMIDLRIFSPAYPLTISGLTGGAAVYNGTWDVDRVFLFENGLVVEEEPSTYIQMVKPPFPSGPDVIPGDQTFQLEQLQVAFSQGIADSVTYYLGTPTQDPDPLIEAAEGAGNVPAWRGLAYAVFERFRITEYGGRIPSMSFLVNQVSGLDSPVADVITSLCARAGIPERLIDVSEVTAQISGIELDRPESLRASLQPILEAFDLLAYEDQGILRFRPRSRATLDASVVVSDIEARESEASRQSATSVREKLTELPTQVVVNYSDPEKAFLRGTQRERWNATRFRAGSSDEVPVSSSEDQRNYAIVLTGTDARKIASRELWIARTRNESLRGVLPPSLMTVRIADQVQVDFGDREEPYLVVGRTVDPETSRTQVTLESLQPQVIAQTGATVIPGTTAPLPVVGSGYSWRIHDPTNFADETLGRFWVSMTRGTLSQPWIPPQLWFSFNGTNYTQLAAGLSESVAGYTFSVESGSGVLGTPTSTSYWDDSNAVDVYVQNGTLSSTTDAAVLNGANRCLIGDEVLAFANATLIGSRTYRLSRLLRGLRGTEHETDNHSEGERFVWTATLIPIDLPIQLLGQPLLFAIVAPGQSPSAVPAQEYTIVGNNRRPFAPLFLAGVRDVAGNLALSWTRRTRRVYAAFHVPTPLEEATENYQIEVRASAGGSVVRTISVSGQTVASYSAFQQALDSLFEADQYIQVFQVGAWGRGLGSEQVVFS